MGKDDMKEMDNFGLTEQEQNMNLHDYNHALFQNMIFFMDIVWEINMLMGTVVILHDRNEPDKSSTELPYREAFRDYVENKISESERPVFERYMAPKNLKNLKEEVFFDIRLHQKDDSWELYRIALTPAIDQYGKPYCIYLGARNLRAEMSRDPAESRNKEQFWMAAMSGALLVYNINLTKNRIGQEVYEMVDGGHFPVLQMLGLTAPCSFDEFAGRWAEWKVLEDSRESFLQMYNREYMLDAYAKGERRLEMEFDMILGNGSKVTLWNTALLVEDKKSGDILAVMNGKDITTQKQAELRQQEALREAYETANRANAAKSEFLTRISHDIRTPLNSIIGMTAIAEKCQDDKERVADCLKKISVSGKYLLSLVDEMLDMSMIESGKMQLQEEEVDLRELFENLGIIFDMQMKERGHDFSAEVLHLEHERILGDRRRIDQVIMNLVDNAAKYTLEEGRIRMTLEERPVNKPGVGCYEIVVEDNGIGIDPEFTGHLFEPFVRGKDRRVRKIQGSGLGLAITHNIVQLMNGSIYVKSEPENGTKITTKIFLKLPKEEETASSQPEASEEDQKSPIQELSEKDFSGRRALLVEDNESNADIICEILEMVGLELEQVWNGQEAVEKITAAEDGYYDIIFMDIQMPVMDGYEAAKAIRALERPYAKKVPILAMSANAFAEDIQLSLAAGMNEHISKPIDLKKLEESLCRWLPIERSGS